MVGSSFDRELGDGDLSTVSDAITFDGASNNDLPLEPKMDQNICINHRYAIIIAHLLKEIPGSEADSNTPSLDIEDENADPAGPNGGDGGQSMAFLFGIMKRVFVPLREGANLVELERVSKEHYDSLSPEDRPRQYRRSVGKKLAPTRWTFMADFMADGIEKEPRVHEMVPANMKFSSQTKLAAWQADVNLLVLYLGEMSYVTHMLLRIRPWDFASDLSATSRPCVTRWVTSPTAETGSARSPLCRWLRLSWTVCSPAGRMQTI